MAMFLLMVIYIGLVFDLPVTIASTHKFTAATVYWDRQHKMVQLKEGVLEEEGDAFGYLNDTLSSTGWSVLEIRSGYGQTPETDEITFFLAGYLEGFLTAQQMMDHHANMLPQLIHNPKVLDLVKSYIVNQDSWTREQVKLKKSSDPLWKHVGFIVAQLDGLQAGVADWAKKKGMKSLSLFDIQFLNAVGDLLDLIPALDSSKAFKLPGMGHCSALIKMLPGFENLLFAHSSWFTYAATMRIYKHWDFQVHEPHTATGKLSFSSYPGFLMSLDDFYLLGSGLMMTQTTNNIFNASLFDKITPNSLLAWQRVRLAHSLAHTGEEWAKTFSKYNSGTYNNQYMVLDRSKVNLGSSIDDGALTVVEQIPGLVEYSDQTQALRRGYWPSYNIPFHQKIYALSGYRQMWEELGEDFSYDLCPRAKIFRRDQADVKDLDSLKYIMRFNDYKKDPYSFDDPCKTICCRSDLKAEGPSPQGCYDTKVTDFLMAGSFVAEAVNGPTTQNGLPPFVWDQFSNISHQGLPQFYNFTFVQRGINTAAGLHIAAAMTNKDCPPGSLWDNLVSACVPSRTDSRPKHGPATEPPLAVVVQQRSTARSAQVNPVMALNPALVIFAMLAILGSILALALWFIVYRRRTSLRSTSEDSEPQQEPLQKTEQRAIIHSLAPERNSHTDMLQGAGGPPSPCSRLHLRAQISSQWEEGFATCSGTTKHAGTEGLRGPPTCYTMREPRIPLPATELGGTALVTTKTM